MKACASTTEELPFYGIAFTLVEITAIENNDNK